MAKLYSGILLFVTYLTLVSADKEVEPNFNPLISASRIELKRIPKPSGDISTSESVASRQRVLPNHRHDDLDDSESIPKNSVVRSDSVPSGNGIFSGTKKFSPKKSGRPSSKPSNGYGYPYRMAPTLPPFVKHISDRHEDESESKAAVVPSRPKIPPMPRIPSMPKVSDDDDEPPKYSTTLKRRQGLPYDDDSSIADFSPSSLDYSSYREPKYRNSYDLEEYSPRRMYQESRGPYSRPSFRFPTPKPPPAVSPRDPYLSPSDEPIDGFYPKVKNNGVSTSYSAYDGKRDKYYKSISDPVPPPPPPPPRVYDDDFSDISSEEDDFPVRQGGYEKSHKYPEEPSPYSEPYDEPAPKEPLRSIGGSYDALYNSPIIGMTRKRLLEYAGASDLYRGEPDYLKSAVVRKTKFGSIQDDYHPYPRSQIYSSSDFHFDESRKVPSRAKRHVIENEETAPRCAWNTTLSMCLRDFDYPMEEVKKVVLKNIKFLSQLRDTRLEITQKKSTQSDPESLEDLKKTNSLCSSKKGYVYPKRAKDDAGIWRTVVNVDNVKQSIEIDVCRSADTPCDYIPVSIPTKCIQKFSFVTLITFNVRDNILEHHDFPIPSACSCSVGRPIRVRLE